VGLGADGALFGIDKAVHAVVEELKKRTKKTCTGA